MTPKQDQGFYLLRILVVLALANLFIYALGSFATSIRLAKAVLSNNENYTALKSLTSNEIRTNLESEHLTCMNTHLLDNIHFAQCVEKTTGKELLFLREGYEEQ